ncbi:hypothetical protein V3N99_12315 [Dermatophilaceae bacterium Soc4.6]
MTASVPPLEMRWVSNRAMTCSRHIRSVRPSRATSGIGHWWNESRTFSAAARPAAASCWYIDRSCW